LPSLTRDAIVAEARSWAGTPFRWQASVKGVGADCRGFIFGVARELGLPEANGRTARADYSSRIPARELKRVLAETFDRADVARPGDLLLIVVGEKPQHLAIVTGPGRMMHACLRGPEQVIEVPIGKSRPIDSIWTWRGLD
jgi:cell wall-associated NlpC family hydrolase